MSADHREPAGEQGARILVVDDDRAVREALRRALTLGGYEVETADDGLHALDAIAQVIPDAVVLDVGMPGIDGLEVCRRLRRLQNRVPILILTARETVDDRIDGLDVGADDYMVKPFDVGELKARLRALLRRAAPRGAAAEGATSSFAELTLDPARHAAVVRDRTRQVLGDGARAGEARGQTVVALTRTEYRLLDLFISNARRVLSPSEIYERVWGYDFGASSNALRVYVGYLRRKLEAAGARPLIYTVRGVGYVLREP